MTHNYGRFIASAIDSVLNQEMPDWELIISDDSSIDDTADIVESFLSDPRIRYVRHEERLGQSGNWSFVLSQGTADRVAVLHADDVWLPRMLSSALDAFANNPDLEIYAANWRVLRGEETDPQPNLKIPSSTFTGTQAYEVNLQGNFLLPSSAVITRSLIQKAGLPLPNLNQFVDFEYALRLFSYAAYVRWDAEPAFLYRHHPSNMSWTTPPYVIAKEFELLPSTCAGHPAVEGEYSRREKQLRFIAGRGIRSLGVKECLKGRWADGGDLLARAQVICPPGSMAVKILVDRLLCHSGALGRKVFRRLRR